MSEITTYEKTKDSGIEWIGSVPSHWRVHTLYQLVTQVKEKNSNLQEKNLLKARKILIIVKSGTFVVDI